MQNLALLSFFVTITTGDDQGPSDFFIIPSFSILSTSSLIIVLLFLSALNCFCAIVSRSPVLILCFTTLVFPSFVLFIAFVISFLFLPYFCCVTIFVWEIFFCFHFYIP